MSECLVQSQRNSLEQITKCGLVGGGGCATGFGFEVSKSQTICYQFLLCPVLVDHMWLSFTSLPAVPTVMLPAMMAMDSPSETVSMLSCFILHVALVMMFCHRTEQQLKQLTCQLPPENRQEIIYCKIIILPTK